jgi:hypothetical protein
MLASQLQPVGATGFAPTENILAAKTLNTAAEISNE